MKHFRCCRVWSFGVSVLNSSSFVSETGRLCSAECTSRFISCSAVSGFGSFAR